MPLKISHLRKNLSILDTEKKRSRENPEIVIRFHVFLPPSIRQFSPLLFFRFPNSRNSYGVSTYTYIYKERIKKKIFVSSVSVIDPNIRFFIRKQMNE